MAQNRFAIYTILKRMIYGLVFSLVLCIGLLSLDQHEVSRQLDQRQLANITAVKDYTPFKHIYDIDSLLHNYGKNKRIPKQYKLQCLLALSHYPELRETPIDFEVRPAFVPLYSWPRPVSVALPWVKRKFMVVISTDSQPFFDAILFDRLPFKDQVGIIGHELAHTVYYQNRSSLQTVFAALKYQFNRRFQNQLEREADQIGIAHGLGYQLYDYAIFVRKAFGMSMEAIEQEEGSNYLSPHEIIREMEKYPKYSDPPPPLENYFMEKPGQ